MELGIGLRWVWHACRLQTTGLGGASRWPFLSPGSDNVTSSLHSWTSPHVLFSASEPSSNSLKPWLRSQHQFLLVAGPAHHEPRTFLSTCSFPCPSASAWAVSQWCAGHFYFMHPSSQLLPNSQLSLQDCVSGLQLFSWWETSPSELFHILADRHSTPAAVPALPHYSLWLLPGLYLGACSWVCPPQHLLHCRTGTSSNPSPS